jgi:cytochrome c biogenesis protein CcmG/thiol:disulfide interchange protein DsbE
MRRYVLPAAIVLVTVGVVGLLVFGVLKQREDRTLDEGARIGQPVEAPSRPLPLVGEPGETSVEDYRGKVVVLNFWASWCKPCEKEAPVLERTSRRLADKGVVVLGVDYRDTENDAVAFERRHRITYPSVRDVEGKLARDYGTVALPETFVIDREGKVVAVRRGVVDAAWLNQALAPLVGT